MLRPRAIIQGLLNLVIIAVIAYSLAGGSPLGWTLLLGVLSLAAINAVFMAFVKVRTSKTQLR